MFPVEGEATVLEMSRSVVSSRSARPHAAPDSARQAQLCFNARALLVLGHQHFIDTHQSQSVPAPAAPARRAPGGWLPRPAQLGDVVPGHHGPKLAAVTMGAAEATMRVPCVRSHSLCTRRAPSLRAKPGGDQSSGGTGRPSGSACSFSGSGWSRKADRVDPSASTAADSLGRSRPRHQRPSAAPPTRKDDCHLVGLALRLGTQVLYAPRFCTSWVTSRARRGCIHDASGLRSGTGLCSNRFLRAQAERQMDLASAHRFARAVHLSLAQACPLGRSGITRRWCADIGVSGTPVIPVVGLASS